jgi:uncharacterized membrane protein (DUF373 family)
MGVFTRKKITVYSQFLITLLMFVYVKDFASIDSFSNLAVALLEFIIVLELVRMVVDFLFSEDNRISLRLMLDSTIIFFVRDIMLIVNDKFDIAKIASILGIIAALFFFRIIATRYSPSVMQRELKGNAEAKEG